MSSASIMVNLTAVRDKKKELKELKKTLSDKTVTETPVVASLNEGKMSGEKFESQHDEVKATISSGVSKVISIQDDVVAKIAAKIGEYNEEIGRLEKAYNAAVAAEEAERRAAAARAKAAADKAKADAAKNKK